MQIRTEDRHLLQAILGKTDEWVDHFRAWEKAICIEHLDIVSFDLLPMLYYKLSKHSLSTPLYPKLRGIYRYIWSQNTNCFDLLAKILALSKTPTLLIKGAALSFSHYPYAGLRRMGDIDLAVREEGLKPFLETLLEKGFRGASHLPIEKTFLSERYRRLEHGLSLAHSDNWHIDLHWHILDECCFQEADDFFWDGAIELDVRGVLTQTLNPTDHLFLTLVHGMQSQNLRWVVDAHLILEKDTIDWERLYKKAFSWNLTLPLIDALSLLKEVGDHPLEKQISRLSVHPTSARERAEHRSRLTQSKSLWSLLVKHWYKHCRRNTPTFGSYWKDRYGVSSYFALFSELKGVLKRKRKNGPLL